MRNKISIYGEQNEKSISFNQIYRAGTLKNTQ